MSITKEIIISDSKYNYKTNMLKVNTYFKQSSFIKINAAQRQINGSHNNFYNKVNKTYTIFKRTDRI